MEERSKKCFGFKELIVWQKAVDFAEGKGRNSKKEFIQYLYIARGSLYETITLATIFHTRKWISDDTYQIIENKSFEIASMIKGLINSISK